MVTVAHKKPCNDCPWRRESAPGWLGGYEAEWFTDHIKAELPLVCHSVIDDDDGLSDEERRETLPLCAGALITQKNMCKSPRDPDLAKAVMSVERDTTNVFFHPTEFIAHHVRT